MDQESVIQEMVVDLDTLCTAVNRGLTWKHVDLVPGATAVEFSCDQFMVMCLRYTYEGEQGFSGTALFRKPATVFMVILPPSVAQFFWVKAMSSLN